MNNYRKCAIWGVAIGALLLSPIVVIFSIPLAIGIGFDIFDLGEVPFALALGAPAAFVASRFVSPRALMRQLAAAHTRPAGLNYAPKSMS